MVWLCKITGLAVLSGLLAGASGTPTAARLEAALSSPDPRDLAALGSGASAAGLEEHITSDQRRAAIAAARAAPHAPDDWALLAALATAARSPDRSIAVEAARAAHRIAAELDRDRVLLHDVPDDQLRSALASWRELGASRDRWADVRVLAMTVGRDIATALGPDATADDVAFDRTARLVDPDPEVRRAALELLPMRDPPLAAIGNRLRDEPDPIVAIVAAQALCSGLAFDDRAEPILAAAGDAGMARLRALVAEAAGLPAAALLDAARCLAVDDSAESRAALADLIRGGPRSIRAQLRSLPRR